MEPFEEEDVPLFTVGQVAEMLQLKQAFLRRVDQLQVVSPQRSNGGQRRYTRIEIRVIQQVASMADEGMTMPAIRRIIELEQQLARVARQRDELAQQLQLLLAQIGRDRSEDQPAGGLAGEVAVGQGARGHGQPAVGQGLLERLGRHPVQLDQEGVVAVEVRDGEEGVGVGGHDRLLLPEVGGADGQDRAVRRRLVAETLDVGLAERALPGERLPADFPRPKSPVPLEALGHLGQLASQAGHIIEGLHESNRTAVTVDWRTRSHGPFDPIVFEFRLF